MKMLYFISVFLLAASEGHESQNPLFRELIRHGVSVGDGENAPLPGPVLPDGLDRSAQLDALEAVIGGDYAMRDFIRPSTVAPYQLRLRDVEPSEPMAPSRGMDVFFVAFGDLESVASEAFLGRNLERNRQGGEARELAGAELATRGIESDGTDADREGYGHLVFPLLDRVQLSVVMHSTWSRTEESIVVAGRIDRRFLGDEAYPNQWRPIERRPGGRDELGQAEPYDGAGYYVKITRLAEPEGALFVEAHLVFTEPRGWFGGANLLRSKLPPVVQAEVRDFRRELARAAQ